MSIFQIVMLGRLVSILYIYHEHKCDINGIVVIVGVIFKWCKTMVRKKTEFLAIGVTFRQALVIWCVVTKSWVLRFGGRQLPAVTGTYRQLPAVTGSYRQLPAVTSYDVVVLSVTLTGSYRQLPAVAGSYRQLPAVTSSYRQLPALSAPDVAQKERCARNEQSEKYPLSHFAFIPNVANQY